MKRSLFRRFMKNERGVSLIEFALVLPILLALVLGIVEFGWLFNGWITINGAAREGARIASAQRIFQGDPLWDGGAYIQEAIDNHVKSLAQYLQPVNYEIDFEETGQGANRRRGVIITVTGQMEPLVGFFVKGSQTLYGKTTMRIE